VIVARPHKREPQVDESPVVLDDKGEALSKSLPELLGGFEVEVGAALDEVVVTVKARDVLDICRTVKDDPRLDFNYLRCLSIVDYRERMEVVYHLFSLAKRQKMVVKASVSPDEPNIPSVVSVWRGADWFEREGHDLFGIVFQGHPNPAPLLLYEGFQGYPGRKDFPFHDYDEW